MAWSAPPSFSANDLLYAADLQIMSDDLAYLKTAVDSGGGASVELKSSGGAGTLTATLGGAYAISGYVVAGTGTGFATYTITAGGSTVAQQAQLLNSTNNVALSCSAVIRLTAGATVSGALVGSTVQSGRLAMVRVGA